MIAWKQLLQNALDVYQQVRMDPTLEWSSAGDALAEKVEQLIDDFDDEGKYLYDKD